MLEDELRAKIDQLNFYSDEEFVRQIAFLEDSLNETFESRTFKGNEITELYEQLKIMISERFPERSPEMTIHSILENPWRVISWLGKKFIRSFNAKGRLSRRGYNQRVLMGIIMLAISGYLAMHKVVFGIIAAYLLIIWFYIIQIKRYHDLGHSGWRVLISFLTQEYIFYLPFVKGEDKTNKWGINPNRKFKLI